jgi:ubiquinone/menaquinone biosynthesis C-methylase UbiE
MPERSERYVHALGFDWLTPLYDPLVAATTREGTFRRRLLAQAAIPAGAAVLDLGCGTGTLAVWAKQAVPDACVTGVDGDPKVLARARAKAERAGVEIRFDEALAHELPYGDASFHRVLSSLFFHHLTRRDRGRAIAEVARVLRPGGELHVADWGRPRGLLARAAARSIRWLDGSDRTRDNLEGRLPELFAAGGLADARLCGELGTIFGTLAFYRAARPAP